MDVFFEISFLAPPSPGPDIVEFDFSYFIRSVFWEKTEKTGSHGMHGFALVKLAPNLQKSSGMMYHYGDQNLSF